MTKLVTINKPVRNVNITQKKNQVTIGNAVGSLVSLIDTLISNPQVNEVLSYNGSKWVNQLINVVLSLNDLTDVGAPSPQDQDVLNYNTNNNQWENLSINNLANNLLPSLDQVYRRKDRTFEQNVIEVYSPDDLLPYFNSGTNEYDMPFDGIILFMAVMDLSYPLRFPTGSGALIGSHLPFRNVVTYKGTGAAIRCDLFFSAILYNLSLYSDGTAGQSVILHDNGSNSAFWSAGIVHFNCDFRQWDSIGVYAGTNVLAIDSSNFIGCKKLGTIRYNGFPSIKNSNWIQGQNDITDIIAVDTLVLRKSVTGNNFVLGSNETLFNISNTIFTDKINIINNVWNGLGTFFNPSGLDETDPRVICKFNPPQADSVNEMWATSTGGVNTIANVNDFEILNANLVMDNASRFVLEESIPASGVFDTIRYIGIETVSIKIDAQSSLESASGGTPTAKLGIGQNLGTIITTLDADYPRVNKSGSATIAKNLGNSIASAIVKIANNDIIRLYVSSSSSSNLTSSDVNINISQPG